MAPSMGATTKDASRGDGARAPTSSAGKKKASGSAASASGGGGTSVSMSAKTAGATGSADQASAISSGDLFARSVSMMAVAHIARGVGFDAVQRSAGDALVDILAKYIQRIGGASKDIAELAGRTQPRATDVMQALQDMLPVPVELSDMTKALETAKRPLPRDIPAFPVRKRDIAGNTIEQTKIGNREDLPPHVPSFLPPLPNRHTYSSESRVVVERDQDTKRTRLDLLGQKSHIQQSLHGLQTVFAKQPTAIVHPPPAWNAFQGATGENASENPFVQPPVVAPSSSSAAKNVFAGPERSFAPNLTLQKGGHKKNAMENTSVTIPKLSNSQELGKEEKILTGTFHDGDSE
ncbi:Transcription initiation factor, partial [Globisporangium splendens]